MDNIMAHVTYLTDPLRGHDEEKKKKNKKRKLFTCTRDNVSMAHTCTMYLHIVIKYFNTLFVLKSFVIQIVLNSGTSIA